MKVLLGIDHGTTRTSVLALDPEMSVVAQGAAELVQSYPQAGWVEQDPLEILTTTRQAVRECIGVLPRGAEIAGVGLSNQGETVLVWERATGAPVYPAIGWQDRRTAEMCAQLAEGGWGERAHARTGLYLDPYFSASKARWIVDHMVDGRARARAGELALGTTDSWLLWNWSGGRLHITDVTTASRTLLLNLHTLAWDEELLELFDLPRSMLAQVLPCAGQAGEILLPGVARAVPVQGLAVDQQAALLGHGCLVPGMVKATYGTGTFVLMNIGATPRLSRQGLVTTPAWQIGDRVAYAMDGGIHTTGATVQWLVEGLGVLSKVEDSDALAREAGDSGGVYFVPALTGLGAPFWDAQARGLLIGLTRATTRAQVVRAALEGIAYRVRDVVDAMETDTGVPIQTLRVDGGAARNTFLMQFQADILNVPVQVASVTEMTARGAALLAGIGLSWWTLEDVGDSWRAAARYEPGMGEGEREARYAQWRRALDRAGAWETPQEAG